LAWEGEVGSENEVISTPLESFVKEKTNGNTTINLVLCDH